MSPHPGDRWEGWTEASDGTRLFTRHWAAPNPAAGVVLVHGLGDHSGRYRELAEEMADRGISVTGFDLRGHGRSPGRRGDLRSLPVVLSDIEALEGESRRWMGEAPTFLFGHSMGGLFVLLRALDGTAERVRGVVASAPWLRTRAPVPTWKELLGRLLSRVAPAWTLDTGLDPESLSRDPEWVRSYLRDPLVHHRISARLYDAVGRAQDRVLAGSLNLPVLVLVPEEDPLVDPDTARSFAASEGADVQEFSSFRHEGFGEIGREAFFRAAIDWILARVAENHRSGQGYPGTRSQPFQEYSSEDRASP